jgi:hypothetical protein
MNIKNVHQMKNLVSSAEAQGFATKMKSTVCEKDSDSALLKTSATGSSEPLIATCQSKKINTNMAVVKEVPFLCGNQIATCTVQRKPTLDVLPNFFKPTKSYLSSLTEKKKFQKSLNQDRLEEKTIKNRLPLKKKSLPVVVSKVNYSKCKNTSLSKIDTEENTQGQRMFICKNRNIALDSHVRPIRPITEFNLSQSLRNKNSKEIKGNEKKSFGKKPSKLLKDRLNDLSDSENRKTLKKKPSLLSFSKSVALPKKLLVKAPVSGSVVSMNVSPHIQIKQKSVPCCVLKKKINKLSFASSAAKNLQNKGKNVKHPYAKNGIKNISQQSMFSKSYPEKNLHKLQRLSQLKELQTSCETLQPVNCNTEELSKNMSTFETKQTRPSCVCCFSSG